ncbi:MAG: hypothetical protein ACYC91_00780 [Solirubrobacteraceae bacterium]
MGARQRLIKAALAACLLACALPVPALASDTQSSILMDDDQLIYASPGNVVGTLEQIRELGVETVKVSVVWTLVAPNAASPRKPNFDATNPDAYPRDAWRRYDLIVREAQQLGLGVYFQLTAPAPRWAVAGGPAPQGHPWSHRPNAELYGEFVRAVAQRYDGSFVDAASDPAPPPSPVLGLNLPTPLGPPASSGNDAQPLPRVSWWGIWNEPNEGAWLNPQYRLARGGRRIPIAPALYRGLVDAGYGALVATGHQGDTILIGETASGGITRPFPFIRALYCVDSGNRPLRGRAAAEVSCPASGNPRSFAVAHPGLFLGAYAHHPYSFDQAPSRPMPDPALVTLANLVSFERLLDRVYRTYGHPDQPGMYLTEFGYKTNPPNPFVRTSLPQQAEYLNQAEYLAYRNPRVRSLAQFLLLDDRPRAGQPVGTLRYWSTYQTGLLYANGTAKPSFDAFRIPIWIPSPRHAARVMLWGQLRPADHSAVQYGVIEYRRGSSGSWSTLREVQTSSSEGFLVAHVAVPRGMVRLAWLDPASGTVEYSRSIVIR